MKIGINGFGRIGRLVLRSALARGVDQVIAAGRAMARAFAIGATLLAFGNGGSTTDAQDLVAELLNPPFSGWLPLPAIALTNDIAVVTAVANDVGFDNVYARQGIAFGRPGEIGLGISTSGNSTNVLVALEQAKKQELLTVGLAGYDGGKMMHSKALDFCINSPSDHIPRIQEAQATVYHALLEVIHGPGCPVCVLPMGRIDDAIAIARMDGVIFTTFGDMMRVPGSKGSLLDAKAEGADVRFVYSPLDALKLARQSPDRQVVFFAIGFETTAPSTAITMLRAQSEGIMNFSVFCNHVTIIPAMKAILDSPDLRLDGFIGPGHVSMVIGMRPYNFVARDHHKPVVIAGFEPLDIIQSVSMIVKQIDEGRAEVENQYSRVVRPEWNVKALEAMARTMELRPFFGWRGLGFITHSALKLRQGFAAWDAELRYEV